MIVLRNKVFSRHTPKNLKKYKEYKDEDIDKMSRGQRLQAIEDEDETAADNTNKYVIKKMKKHAGIGAGVGAVGGALLGKGAGVKGALAMGAMGGILGGSVGAATGDMRGRHVAKKEGHDRDERSTKLSKRIDARARALKQDDDYEIRNRDRIRSRKALEAAQQARDAAYMANYNSAGARFGF